MSNGKKRPAYTTLGKLYEAMDQEPVHGVSFPGTASSFWDAAWREGNLFVAGADWVDNHFTTFDTDESFKRLYQDNMDNFLGPYSQYKELYPELLSIGSLKELDYRKGRIARDVRQRKRLEQETLMSSILPYLFVGAFSPENWVPIAGAVRLGFMGKSGLAMTGLAKIAPKLGDRLKRKAMDLLDDDFMEAARRTWPDISDERLFNLAKQQVIAKSPLTHKIGATAIEGMLSAAIAEPFYHADMPLRTQEESLGIILGSGVLGGGFGAVFGGIGSAYGKLLFDKFGFESLTHWSFAMHDQIGTEWRAVDEALAQEGLPGIMESINEILTTAGKAGDEPTPRELEQSGSILDGLDNPEAVELEARRAEIINRVMQARDPDSPIGKLVGLGNSNSWFGRLLGRMVSWSPNLRAATVLTNSEHALYERLGANALTRTKGTADALGELTAPSLDTADTLAQIEGLRRIAELGELYETHRSEMGGIKEHEFRSLVSKRGRRGLFDPDEKTALGEEYLPEQQGSDRVYDILDGKTTAERQKIIDTVNKAVEDIYVPYIDEVGKALAAVGLIRVGDSAASARKQAAHYIGRIYDKSLVARNRTRFKNTIREGLKQTHDQEMPILLRRLDDLDDLLGKARDELRVQGDLAEANVESIRARIESYEGMRKSTQEDMAALRLGTNDQDGEMILDQIVRNIIGDRVAGADRTSSNAVENALHARVLDLEDRFIEPYLINDIGMNMQVSVKKYFPRVIAFRYLASHDQLRSVGKINETFSKLERWTEAKAERIALDRLSPEETAQYLEMANELLDEVNFLNLHNGVTTVSPVVSRVGDIPVVDESGAFDLAGASQKIRGLLELERLTDDEVHAIGDRIAEIREMLTPPDPVVRSDPRRRVSGARVSPEVNRTAHPVLLEDIARRVLIDHADEVAAAKQADPEFQESTRKVGVLNHELSQTFDRNNFTDEEIAGLDAKILDDAPEHITKPQGDEPSVLETSWNAKSEMLRSNDNEGGSGLGMEIQNMTHGQYLSYVVDRALHTRVGYDRANKVFIFPKELTDIATPELLSAILSDAPGGYLYLANQGKLPRGLYIPGAPDVRTIIQGFHRADASSALHEQAHAVRRTIFKKAYLNNKNLSNLKKQDAKKAAEWSAKEAKRVDTKGVETGVVEYDANGEAIWNVGMEEAFARGFEKYIMDGDFPPGANAALKRAFEVLSKILRTIYEGLVHRGNLPETLHPDMKKIYDKIVSRGDFLDGKGKKPPALSEIKKGEIRDGFNLVTDDEADAVFTVFEAMGLDQEYIDYESPTIAQSIVDSNKRREDFNRRRSAQAEARNREEGGRYDPSTDPDANVLWQDDIVWEGDVGTLALRQGPLDDARDRELELERLADDEGDDYLDSAERHLEDPDEPTQDEIEGAGLRETDEEWNESLRDPDEYDETDLDDLTEGEMAERAAERRELADEIRAARGVGHEHDPAVSDLEGRIELHTETQRQQDLEAESEVSLVVAEARVEDAAIELDILMNDLAEMDELANPEQHARVAARYLEAVDEMRSAQDALDNAMDVGEPDAPPAPAPAEGAKPFDPAPESGKFGERERLITVSSPSTWMAQRIELLQKNDMRVPGDVSREGINTIIDAAYGQEGAEYIKAFLDNLHVIEGGLPEHPLVRDILSVIEGGTDAVEANRRLLEPEKYKDLAGARGKVFNQTEAVGAGHPERGSMASAVFVREPNGEIRIVGGSSYSHEMEHWDYFRHYRTIDRDDPGLVDGPLLGKHRAEMLIHREGATAENFEPGLPEVGHFDRVYSGRSARSHLEEAHRLDVEQIDHREDASLDDPAVPPALKEALDVIENMHEDVRIPEYVVRSDTNIIPEFRGDNHFKGIFERAVDEVTIRGRWHTQFAPNTYYADESNVFLFMVLDALGSEEGLRPDYYGTKLNGDSNAPFSPDTTRQYLKWRLKQRGTRANVRTSMGDSPGWDIDAEDDVVHLLGGLFNEEDYQGQKTGTKVYIDPKLHEDVETTRTSLDFRKVEFESGFGESKIVYGIETSDELTALGFGENVGLIKRFDVENMADAKKALTISLQRMRPYNPIEIAIKLDSANPTHMEVARKLKMTEKGDGYWSIHAKETILDMEHGKPPLPDYVRYGTVSVQFPTHNDVLRHFLASIAPVRTSRLSVSDAAGLFPMSPYHSGKGLLEGRGYFDRKSLVVKDESGAVVTNADRMRENHGRRMASLWTEQEYRKSKAIRERIAKAYPELANLRGGLLTTWRDFEKHFLEAIGLLGQGDKKEIVANLRGSLITGKRAQPLHRALNAIKNGVFAGDSPKAVMPRLMEVASSLGLRKKLEPLRAALRAYHNERLRISKAEPNIKDVRQGVQAIAGGLKRRKAILSERTIPIAESLGLVAGDISDVIEPSTHAVLDFQPDPGVAARSESIQSALINDLRSGFERPTRKRSPEDVFLANSWLIPDIEASSGPGPRTVDRFHGVQVKDGQKTPTLVKINTTSDDASARVERLWKDGFFGPPDDVPEHLRVHDYYDDADIYVLEDGSGGYMVDGEGVVQHVWVNENSSSWMNAYKWLKKPVTGGLPPSEAGEVARGIVERHLIALATFNGAIGAIAPHGVVKKGWESFVKQGYTPTKMTLRKVVLADGTPSLDAKGKQVEQEHMILAYGTKNQPDPALEYGAAQQPSRGVGYDPMGRVPVPERHEPEYHKTIHKPGKRTPTAYSMQELNDMGYRVSGEDDLGLNSLNSPAVVAKLNKVIESDIPEDGVSQGRMIQNDNGADLAHAVPRLQHMALLLAENQPLVSAHDPKMLNYVPDSQSVDSILDWNAQGVMSHMLGGAEKPKPGVTGRAGQPGKSPFEFNRWGSRLTGKRGQRPTKEIYDWVALQQDAIPDMDYDAKLRRKAMSDPELSERLGEAPADALARLGEETARNKRIGRDVAGRVPIMDPQDFVSRWAAHSARIGRHSVLPDSVHASKHINNAADHADPRDEPLYQEGADDVGADIDIEEQALVAELDELTDKQARLRRELNAHRKSLYEIARTVGTHHDENSRARPGAHHYNPLPKFRHNKHASGADTVRSADAIVRQRLNKVKGETFGDGTSLESQFAEMEREYAPLYSEAESSPDGRSSTGHTVAQLDKRKRQSKRDTQAMLERVYGTHGLTANPSEAAMRFSSAARDFNYLRMMGGVALSSLPDVAMAISTAGFRHYLGAWGQFLRGNLTTKDGPDGIAYMHYAAETVLGETRATKTFMLDDSVEPRHSWLEQQMHEQSQRFGKLSGIQHWNGMMKAIAASALQSRMMEMAYKIRDGKASDLEKEMLRQFGISPQMAARAAHIHGQRGVGESGVTATGKVFYHTRIDRWNGAIGGMSADEVAHANTMWTMGVMQAVNRTIVTPGVGDLPLIATSSPWGKLLFQFKSFTLAATNQVLITGMQRGIGYGDLSQLVLLLGLTSLGSLVYTSKEMLAGRDPFDRKDWLSKFMVEGIDRGGALGVLTELNAILEKVFGYGMSSLTESGPLTRYMRRNKVDALLGPTMGLFGDLLETVGAAPQWLSGKEDVSRGKASALRRMIPWQNLLQTRGIFDVAPSLMDGNYFDNFKTIQERIRTGIYD